MSARRPVFTVLAEGRLGLEGAKTAASAVRYLPDRVAALIDGEHAGADAADVLGFGRGVPVVGSLEEALAARPAPEALLIGVAPQGGALPDAWRPLLRDAMAAGLDVWAGLHDFLADDPELAAAADRHGVRLVDLRRPPEDLPVATGRVADTGAFRVLTVGTDCNVGKMTTTLEVRAELERRGVACGFGATGQTGILIEGRGVAVDAVVADFVAGAAEVVTLEAAGEIPPRTGPFAAERGTGLTRAAPDVSAETSLDDRGPGAAPGRAGGGREESVSAETSPDRGGGIGDREGGSTGAAALPRPDVVLVEGQGSLLHPGYSGVTLGLVHGVMPQAMILCWMPSRETIYSGRYDWVEIPPLEEVVRRYEDASGWIRPPEPSRVVGISATTYDLPEAEARGAVERARESTGLPVTDPVRFGPGPLADAVEAAMR